MYLRHDVLHAMLHWQAECVEHPSLWDQNLFKDVLKIGGLKFRQTPALQQKRIFKGYNGSALSDATALRTAARCHATSSNSCVRERHLTCVFAMLGTRVRASSDRDRDSPRGDLLLWPHLLYSAHAAAARRRALFGAHDLPVLGCGW